VVLETNGCACLSNKQIEQADAGRSTELGGRGERSQTMGRTLDGRKTMSSWDPSGYLRFADERTRPSVDLVATRVKGVLAMELVRAARGESVLVCVSTIKADRRDDFRRYLDEVKGPAVQAVKPDVHASVRLLEPSQPNADGTWTFVWLMDPAIVGEDYEMEPMYEAFYGHDQVAERMREWDECHATEQVCYELVQSTW
jgi:hypothetical protein